jgi:hypothetical protein
LRHAGSLRKKIESTARKEVIHMSAYIVEDKTINIVVGWLERELANSRFTLDRLAREFDIDLASDKWDEKLAHAMLQLNCDGVNVRYGEEKAEKFRPHDFVYEPERHHSLVQVIKSLQCWKYQCSEGDVPDTKLYQFFEEVEKYIALKIVTDLPDYDKAIGDSLATNCL